MAEAAGLPPGALNVVAVSQAASGSSTTSPMGSARAAKAVYGGGIPEGKDRGFYFEPMVLVDVEPDMRIAREETFGPVGVRHDLRRHR